MKTLWFRYTYIVFVLSSKFRPRVIPMLYSFYLIVYLICISYYYYIFLLYIPLFHIIISFFMCYFVVCRLYIGFLLSLIMGYNGDLWFFILCLLFLGFYDNIWDIHYLLWGFLCDNIDLWLPFFSFYVLFGVMGI